MTLKKVISKVYTTLAVSQVKFLHRYPTETERSQKRNSKSLVADNSHKCSPPLSYSVHHRLAL